VTVVKRLVWLAIFLLLGAAIWGSVYVVKVLVQTSHERHEVSLVSARALAAGDVEEVLRVWTFGSDEANSVVFGRRHGSPIVVWYDEEGKLLAKRPWDANAQERELRERLQSGAVHLPWDDGPSLQGGELIRLVPAYARGVVFWEAVVRTPDAYVYVDIDPEGARVVRAFTLPLRGM